MKNNWIGSINGFGSLNSIYQKVVLPSDTWKMSHNIIVKLPALVAPAFTRIKGIVNSYYCSYASVWNYWNSFISDRPEDVFLSRSLVSAYKGKFVEPCVNMMWISFICKIARGFFLSSSNARKFSVVTGTDSITITAPTMFKSSSLGLSSPTTITWSVTDNGWRLATLTPNVASDGTGFSFDYESDYVFTYPFVSQDDARKLGFYDNQSYFIYQCQQVERNLSNHGVPTDILASTEISFYQGDYFNLLPFMCESSIWHNFYRDEQNQAPEFDYREVNGNICSVNPFNSSSFVSMPSGWHLRLLGIPPNVSTGSDYWFKLSTITHVLSVLTGFCLEEVVKSYFMSDVTSTTNITILPKYYNGLLVLRYRNFEKDYFTSASIDPNMGGVSISTPSTIDALRTASKLEEFLELSGSARDFYNFMKHLFGTNPESTRYQKPLLLGTEVVPVQIGEQLQTSESTSSSPLGDRAGVADAYGNGGTCNHFFNEHGHLVTFLSFVLDSQYMQGMPHEFFHHLQLDYPFPHFANLGAESIPLREIYYSSDNFNGVSYSDDTISSVVDGNVVDSSSAYEFTEPTRQGYVRAGLDVVYEPIGSSTGTLGSSVLRRYPTDIGSNYSVRIFGYTPRYSRWKFAQDVVAGQMRDSLEFWHTFRHFSTRPFISNNFVSYMNAGFLSNLNRIFAVVNDNADKFVVDVFNNASVRRCLPLVPQTSLD